MQEIPEAIFIVPESARLPTHRRSARRRQPSGLQLRRWFATWEKSLEGSWACSSNAWAGGNVRPEHYATLPVVKLQTNGDTVV